MRASEQIKAAGGAWPTGRRPSLVRRAVQFVKAIASREASDETVRRRLAACEACSELDRAGDQRFCRACGCPAWRFADLGAKAKHSAATCPLGKW